MAFHDELNAYRNAGLEERARIMRDVFDFYCEYSYLF